MTTDDTLDCHAAARLISSALDDALAPADAERMQRHFLVCATCRNVDDQMAFLRRAMRGLGRDGHDSDRKSDSETERG